MKKLLVVSSFVFSILVSINARDFHYGGITYTVIDEDAKTCETKQGICRVDNYTDETTGIPVTNTIMVPGNRISGVLDIPSLVYDENSILTVVKIGDNSFCTCSVTDLYIPPTVSEIGESAFAYTDLQTFIIPNTVSTLGSNAFGYIGIRPGGIESKTLIKFAYPEKFESSFIDNSKGFRYPDNAKITYTDSRFLSQAYIESVDGEEIYYVSPTFTGEFSINPNVKIIGDYAFEGCRSITNISSLPESLETVGIGAFIECPGIEELHFYTNLKQIGESAFNNCPNLKKVIFEDTEGDLKLEGEIFASCYSLESVRLPNNLTIIPSCAFESCKSLTEINMPQSLNIIDAAAFAGCLNISEITIPANVQRVNYNAFKDCSGLKTLIISGDETRFGNEVFSGCSSLASISYDTTNPIEASQTLFDSSTYSTATLFVSQEAENQIKALVPWKYFTNIEAKDISNINSVINELLPEESFSLSGIRIPKNYEPRQSGVVIFRSGGKAHKIHVK